MALGSSLLGAASTYPYPLTSGLMGALAPALNTLMSQPAANANANSASVPAQNLFATPAPYTGPDYNATALSMAGNPDAGERAAVAAPAGIPGTANASSSSGSSVGSTLATILGALGSGASGASSLSNLLGLGSTASGTSLLGQIENLITGGQTTPLASLGGSALADPPDLADVTGNLDTSLDSDADSALADADSALGDSGADAADAAAQAADAGIPAVADVGEGAAAGLATDAADAATEAADAGIPAVADVGSDAGTAAASAASDAPSALAGGLTMAGAGLLATLGDIYGNPSEAASAEGQAAEGAANQAQLTGYQGLLGGADLDNPSVLGALSPSFSTVTNPALLASIQAAEKADATAPASSPAALSPAQAAQAYLATQGYANPLASLADLMGTGSVGTPGNSVVAQMVGQSSQGLTPTGLLNALEAYSNEGIPVGAGGWGITANDLQQAGLSAAQIASLGL